jgi:integrase
MQGSLCLSVVPCSKAALKRDPRVTPNPNDGFGGTGFATLAAGEPERDNLMRKTLTAALVEKTLPPATGRLEIHDSIIPQLALRITPNGRKSFVLRTRIDGKQVRVTLGDAAMDLKDVRDAASEALKKCKVGVNPREERRLRLLEAEKATVLAVPNVIAEFLTRHVSKNRTALETKRIFENDVIPRWKNKLLSEVTRTDVVAILDAVEDRASPYRANRVLAAIRKMFNWSVSRGLITVSLIVRDMAREGEIARDRFLSPDEIRAVWQAAEKQGGPFGSVVRMLLVTGQRRGEVRDMKWGALDLQSERIWTLTPDDTKAKRQHIVPLTQPALSIIEEQPIFDKGKYVFTTMGDRPVTGFGKAKQELDKLVAVAAEKAGSKPIIAWRLHDLRRTVATHMENALGIPPHVVGSVLNHDPKGYKGITATYTRGSLLYERRRAMTAWARFLGLTLNTEIWSKIERLVRPETEADAARTDEFRRMIQSDAEAWGKYLAMLLEAQPINVVAMRR